MPRHLPDRGPDEELERHHRAHGIAGQADPGNSPEHAESHRRARPHPELPEALLHAQLVEHAAQVVVLADADPGGGDQQVGVERAGRSAPAGSRACRGRCPRFTGSAPARRTSASSVCVLLLAVLRPLRISSGWSTSTISSPLPRMATRGWRYTSGCATASDASTPSCGGAQLGARAAARSGPSGCPRRRAGCSRRRRGRAMMVTIVGALVGVLLADHGVRALRERRAGEDAGALARPDRAGWESGRPAGAPPRASRTGRSAIAPRTSAPRAA